MKSFLVYAYWIRTDFGHWPKDRRRRLMHEALSIHQAFHGMR